MSAQGHYHQVRVLQSQILNPGQWDFQVCSGSVGPQQALEKRWLLLWWWGPCCGPQRMIMWPPKGPEAQNKINDHSIPGSASAPGASPAWDRWGVSGQCIRWGTPLWHRTPWPQAHASSKCLTHRGLSWVSPSTALAGWSQEPLSSLLTYWKLCSGSFLHGPWGQSPP